MANVMAEMMGTDFEAQAVLGGGNPDVPQSYDAQMEILAKKIYQNQNFYTNLLDKAANVKRIQASQQAIKLMQRRDLYESMVRRELLLSQMLEQATREEAKSIRSKATR